MASDCNAVRFGQAGEGIRIRAPASKRSSAAPADARAALRSPMPLMIPGASLPWSLAPLPGRGRDECRTVPQTGQWISTNTDSRARWARHKRRPRTGRRERLRTLAPPPTDRIATSRGFARRVRSAGEARHNLLSEWSALRSINHAVLLGDAVGAMIDARSWSSPRRSGARASPAMRDFGPLATLVPRHSCSHVSTDAPLRASACKMAAASRMSQATSLPRARASRANTPARRRARSDACPSASTSSTDAASSSPIAAMLGWKSLAGCITRNATPACRVHSATVCRSSHQRPAKGTPYANSAPTVLGRDLPELGGAKA